MNNNIIEFTKKFIKVCSEEYTAKLNMLYKESYSENPEAFPFANTSSLDAYIIRGNRRFLSYPNSIYLFQGRGIVEELEHITDEEYAEFLNYRSDSSFIKYIIEKRTGEKKVFYYQDVSILDRYISDVGSIELILEKYSETISYSMLEQIRNDGYKFINHINKEASYYAKDAFRYVYTDLDFTSVLKLVDDENFEYALNESIACYDLSLYLAACSTAGTALENLMVTKLEREGMFDDNSSTEIGELSGRLKNLKSIDKRDRTRILTAAKFRNLASHANDGKVVREDARMVYHTIFHIAKKLFTD